MFYKISCSGKEKPVKENYIYPIVLHREREGYLISFPDFPDQMTDAETEEQAIKAAQEVLALCINNNEDMGKEPPKPKKPEEIILGEDLLVIDELDIVENRDYMLMESKLFKFFTSKKISYKEVPDIENILNQEYVQMYNFVLKNAFEREDISPMWARDFPCKQEIKDPHHVLSTAGFTRSRIKNQMSENEIFLTFWLTLHFGSKNVQKFNNKVKEIDDLNIKELLEYTFDYQKKSVLLKYE